MKRFLYMTLLGIVIIPSVAAASWWNPFSWSIFKKKDVTPQTQVVNTEKTSDEKIQELQKQVDELKSLKLTPKNTTSVSNKVVPVIPVIDNSAAIKAEAEAKIRAEIEEKLVKEQLDIAKAESARLDQEVAKKRLKQEKLAVVNKKIADLNVKYSQDLVGCNSQGLLPFVQACISSVNTDYDIRYNILAAEFQQIQYSN